MKNPSKEASLPDADSKHSFMNDYSEGAHPRILEALSRNSPSQQSSYRNDDFCRQAREMLQDHIGSKDASIFFLPTGTSANLVLLASCLRPHEAIIATSSAYIAVYEAGAIEATGHKIITTPGTHGKLSTKDIEYQYGRNTLLPHKARPKMVFISNATELGSVYTKSQLTEISNVCRKLGLMLLIDGARLGAALSCSKNDLMLRDIYELADMFWIGGTKSGALFGEAVVIKDKQLAADFPFHMKQRGALLARGWILGVQFLELFRDNLVFDLGRHANLMAQRLSAGLVGLGYRLWAETETNQVFALLPRSLTGTIQTRFSFMVWEELEDDLVVGRFVTTWATRNEDVEVLVTYIKHLSNIG